MHVVRVPAEENTNFFVTRPDRLCDLPDMLWLPAVLHTAAKWTGREADHPCPYSVDVTNECIYTSTPLRIRGIMLNSTVNFTLTYYNILIHLVKFLVGELIIRKPWQQADIRFAPSPCFKFLYPQKSFIKCSYS